MASIELPKLPAPHAGIVDLIADNPEKPMSELMAPYREYESILRTVFAQDRGDPRLDDPYINVLPLFTDKTARVTTRARDIASESEAEKERYIMALPDDKRRPHGSPATVGSLKDFRKNFGIFSENSLADLDWSNVVAAGSSVVNCLLPVPAEYNTTKRKLREYYHQKFCPASDVDLFLYGLNEEQAIAKIKQIEQAVRDAILSEVTVVRTKYAITIASQYPTRHVQIVMRSYKSISEILTGFDIDAAGGLYDGSQVYVTPRALGSFITQINHVDLSRRSPSYENRLSKYSHRNFEIYWSELDRSLVDPTIFERSFQRTLGLARLLVLERLPSASAREEYLNRRREERGRPTVHVFRDRLPGNIKDDHEDEVADWVGESEVSNYHTFTVPYGERFHAKKIEKLCYTRDLLLNAEWNQQKREVYLHRHPAFFGRVEDVIKDCCGYCPVPVTAEEIEVSKKEAEVYISGDIKLMVDDPGRQQIGSFNPLTENDWTDMAYVGNTARLCQSIVDADVDDVLAWLSQPGADANRRDYTGRTPLQLAVMCSTPEVVKCFVDHGARLTARMADGKTALHLAAERGIPEIIKLLMEKSLANEELEDEKQAQKRKLLCGSKKDKPLSDDEEMTQDVDGDSGEDSDVEMVYNEEDSDDGIHSFATGSFVKVKSSEKDAPKELEEIDESEPDFYKIDVLSWDIPSSPLHLAIACGHEDVVKMLCDYGGDSLLPVKFFDDEKQPSGAILPLTLASELPLEKAKSMAKLLLSLGATSAQADMDNWTALHRYVQSAHPELVDALLEHDKMGVVAINHLTFARNYWGQASSPLHTAVARGEPGLVKSVINAGAKLEIDFETWLKAAKASTGPKKLGSFESNKETYNANMLHPLITALIHSTNTDLAIALVEHGADPNSMTRTAYTVINKAWSRSYNKGQTALDVVRNTLDHLRRRRVPTVKPQLRPGLDKCLGRYKEGTYQHWVVSQDVAWEKESHGERMKEFEKNRCEARTRNDNFAAQRAAMEEKISGLRKLEKLLVSKGAKTFAELHPKIVKKHRDVYRRKESKRKPDERYEYKFSFSHVSDMTDARQEAYIQLFEAAWVGDLETIKSLTLHSWGADNTEPPLKITIADNDDNTIFSLAFFRGHTQVAWGILEIAQAQYSPPDEEKKLYQLRMGGKSSDNSECDSETQDSSADQGNHEPRVVSKTVDENFTIDNVGEVSMKVKSEVTAIDFMLWRCNTFSATDGVPDSNRCSKRTLWEFFTHRGDRDMQAFDDFLDMCVHFGAIKDAVAGIDQNSSTPDETEFQDMVESGKVKVLKEVIRRTGAGIPLDSLVKKSGVEVKQKSQYYQGLSVYGKKRKDWATAGRNMYVKPTGLKTPPLLHAAAQGWRDMVEWLLSDEPLRLYTEFSQSKAAENDGRLKLLTSNPGRFESVVSKWLGYQRELVIHCVVIATETEETIGLLKHLIKTQPTFLEVKDTEKNTPLLTAARLGRTSFMRLLIGAGADESTRNKSGENITHQLALHATDPKQYRVALDLLDAKLREHLLKQRTSLENGGFTALHRLVYEFQNHDSLDAQKSEELIRLHLEYSKGVELEMLNSTGDSVLHTAVMGRSPWLTRLLVGFCPRLLYRENAVGRTPAELAYHNHISDVFTQPKNYSPWVRCSNPSAWLTTIREEAVPHPPNVYKASVDGVWDLCRTEMERHPGRRRLVSLHEANDVAKRLGEQYTSSRYFSASSHDDDGKSEEADSKQELDLIDEWANYTSAWVRPKTDEEEKLEEEARLGPLCDTCGHRHPADDDDQIDSDFFSDGSDGEDESDSSDESSDDSNLDGSSGSDDNDGSDMDGSDMDGSDIDEDSD